MIWLKGALALIAGFLVVAIGSEGTDYALQSAGIFPPLSGGAFPSRLLLIATLHRSLWGILGSFVAAKLAPREPMIHALILGGIGTLLNILGLIVMWKVGAHWYPVTLAVTALPCAWLGGYLAGGTRRQET